VALEAGLVWSCDQQLGDHVQNRPCKSLLLVWVGNLASLLAQALVWMAHKEIVIIADWQHYYAPWNRLTLI
jgi:hypothetical protein